MKLIVAAVLIALLSFATSLYLPWWSIAAVALLVIVLIPQPPLHAFLAGFFSVFILWSFMALRISSNNEHLLAKKVSLIILQSEAPVSLAFVSGLIGALVAGFAALAGSFLRRAKNEKPSDYHLH